MTLDEARAEFPLGYMVTVTNEGWRNVVFYKVTGYKLNRNDVVLLKTRLAYVDTTSEFGAKYWPRDRYPIGYEEDRVPDSCVHPNPLTQLALQSS